MLRRILPGFIALAVIAVPVGFAAFPGGRDGGSGDVLRRGHQFEPESLDPHKTDGLEEYAIQVDLFQGLTRFDAHGRLIPALAERWETSSDGLTWTFHLRPGLRWSDGAALTAADVVWSLRRAVDPQTAASYASALYPIVAAHDINAGRIKDLTALGVADPDPSTVVIHLTEPTAYLHQLMALGITMVLPRQAIERYGDQWTRIGKIVTDGAFMLTEWVPEDHISLRPNPAYWNAAAVKLRGVDWEVFSDDLTGLRSFRNGELDMARVPVVDYPAVKKTNPGELHDGINLWTTFIIVNTGHPPLTDARIRQALAMSIDRAVLATSVVPHGQKPAVTLVPPGIEGYTPQPPDWAALSLPDRVARARQLMAEAGYTAAKPLSLTLIYPSEESTKRELGAVVDMWAKIGLDVRIQAEENQIVESETRNHDFELSYYGWIADYPDAWSFLAAYRSEAGGLDTPDYRSSVFDGFLKQASAALDPAERTHLMEQAERQFSADEPLVPMAFNETPRLVSPRVVGFFDNLIDVHASEDLSLEPASRVSAGGS